MKSSGTLTISQTDLKLVGNSTLTSDMALSFVNLNLNDFKLTLGSATSDLTVVNAITIDATTEGILSGGADLVKFSALTLSAGDLTSIRWNCFFVRRRSAFRTREIGCQRKYISFGWEFQLKSSGTLTISLTDLTLGSGNSTLTSDLALSFVNLNLNDF